MADLKSIGKAIGRVATNYLEAQAKKVSNHVEKEEKIKYDRHEVTDNQSAEENTKK